ncbi:hypothetical protein CEXT_456101 [Caerostris extrusa]|uniref:Uncharacterized protein n=1 Tax=Caerostris extrusa TaxID=172846 RepID=A0AAV4RX62_CAEEX|nr:hypothetical protein CEXT_456101 [Caerostris extrusa]
MEGGLPSDTKSIYCRAPGETAWLRRPLGLTFCTPDKSVFQIMTNKFVSRPGDEYYPNCFVPIVKHATSVMVWPMLNFRGTRHLQIVEGTIKQDQFPLKFTTGHTMINVSYFNRRNNIAKMVFFSRPPSYKL